MTLDIRDPKVEYAPNRGLAILGLDVVALNILSLSAFVRAGHSLLSVGS